MSGSSEKYSKLRPLSGSRWMFIPGASHSVAPYSTISLPIAVPTCLSRSRSQVWASMVPIGHAVANW